MAYRQSSTFEDPYVYPRISNPPSSPLHMLASVVLEEKTLAIPRPFMSGYKVLSGSIGYPSTSPFLANRNYHYRPYPPPMINSANMMGKSSFPVVLPPIQSLLGNTRYEVTPTTRPSLPTPPLLENDIYDDKILIANMTSILSRTDSICNALGIMKKQLYLQMKAPRGPLIVGSDGRSVISISRFNSFKDQIPEKTIDLLSKDLILLADSLRAIRSQRCCKERRMKPEVLVTPSKPPKIANVNKSLTVPRVSKTVRQPRKSIIKAAPSHLANSSCQHCGLRETPEWRKGPDGSRSLCNACGLFYSKLQRKFGRQDAAKVMEARKNTGDHLNRVVPSSI